MDKFDEQARILPLCSRPRLNANMANAVIAFVALVSWLTPGGAKAELTVIYDTGTASPISGFVKAPRLAVPEGLPDINLQTGDGFAAHLFPVHTPELTPGDFNPQATQLLLPQPFFIIGCDARSRQWLGRYQGRLAQIGAVGLVVEADSLAEFQDLSSLANGLRLSPVQGSQLAKQLGISHYPALVSASRIEQ
jgi:integrating conjugative element protein (TIGR03765 family)